MRTRGYRVCLSVPLGRRNGAMVLHEADGKVHGWWEVMAPRNTLSGTVSADGRLTLSGVLQTLISTVLYTVEGTFDGKQAVSDHENSVRRILFRLRRGVHIDDEVL